MTLGQETIPERIVYARAPRKLPTVLGGDEIVRLIPLQPQGAGGADDGLRRGCSGFRSRDAEGERHRQQSHGDADRARQGGKERYAMLSAPLLASCAATGGWRAHLYLFSLPGKYPQLMYPPGSETGPGQLVTWGKSVVCSVDAFGFKFQWTTNSSKHIPFDWTGPG
jgi:hypothetical protein